MNLSAPFIERPVATTLLTVAIAIAGILAFFQLPVAPLPQVDFPTISVSANLPGASPEVMAATVATPLERAFGRIAAVTEMTSASTQGSTRITLQFDLGRDIDGAARDVQAAIQAARTDLPANLPSNPSYRKVNPADAPIMILALTSESVDQGQMYDAADTVLAQKLAQVEGVGQVAMGGSSLPAVRIELDPNRLNHHGISLPEVRNAIVSAHADRPKGSVTDNARDWQIETNAQATRASDYAGVILSHKSGAAIRLQDVARVTDSVEDVRNAGLANGRPSVTMILFRQPGANIIATAERVRALLPQLRAAIPASIQLDVVLDRTSTIRASLHEVQRTLALSVGLVILVVFLFLRNGRAALIPTVAVPVSLIGTFGVMYLCGYSLDNLSLMALTIATGFVVDDAIVVLENIARHIENGMPPREAAARGAREVGFTVLAMSVSLIAVFVPILLMSGVVGRLFREFAITLSVAILVSLVVSLTTTPMMCARLLRAEPTGRSRQQGGPWFRAVQGWYDRSLRWALLHPRLVMLSLLITVGCNFYLYLIVPKGFFPQQDTGRLAGTIQADQSISFPAMEQKLAQMVDIVRADPDVMSVVGSTGGGRFGGSQRNSGSMFVSLHPLTRRTATADQVIARLRGKLATVPGAVLFLQAVQDVRIGGRPTGAQFQYTLSGDNLDELRVWTSNLQRALAQSRQISDVNSDQQIGGLQMALQVDRDLAARLGIDATEVDRTLNLAFGQAQIATILATRNQYRIVMTVAPEFSNGPQALDSVYVRSSTGRQVPLAAFCKYEPSLTPLAVNHQGVAAAATISFNLGPGTALGDAVRIIQDATLAIGMPTSIRGTFQGTAQAFQEASANQPLLILAALIAVYIVLGILYESLIHPITILSTLPSAGVGALLALLACNTEFSMIALVGVVLLIGIVKKNAILMIDCALQLERQDGLSPATAIHLACLQRLRPILMTTLAALFAAVPLAIGAGDGAELRRPLGISIVGGLAVSQVLTLYTTPVIYLYLDRFRRWCASWRQPAAPTPIPVSP